MSSSPGAEERLLLSCVRRSQSADRKATISGLLDDGNIDWPHLLRLAVRHDVAPLLHRGLAGVGEEGLPGPVGEALCASSGANMRRNLFLVRELVQIVDLLDRNGIEAVPYKGPVLAASVYGDLSLRRFYDLDVLVPKRDVVRAKELLESCGYRPEYRLTPALERAVLRSSSEYNLDRDDGRVHLELHWRILPSYLKLEFDSERLWKRLEPVAVGGATFKSLSTGDLVLVLCAHGGYKHRWERLKWICDLAELIDARPGIRWQAVFRQAEELGCERIVNTGLLLVSRLLGVELPDEAQAKVASDRAARSLAASVEERLFETSEERPRLTEKCLFHLRSRERWQDRLGYAWNGLVPNAKDWAAVPLPGPLHFLYYLVRPVRILAEYGFGLETGARPNR